MKYIDLARFYPLRHEKNNIMKNTLLLLPFIILLTTPLTAQSLFNKGDMQLIRPNEKRSTTQNQNYDIELRIAKGIDRDDIAFTHNRDPFGYRYDPRSGQINANVQLRHGNNMFALEVGRKTHQFLIAWQPVNDNFRPSPPRPNLTDEPKPTTLDELEPEVHTVTTSQPYFPIEAELEGIKSRRQILLTINKKRIKDYIFKNNALKAEIPLRKGVNEIVLAIENEEGVDIIRWEVTYLPEKPKPNFGELEERDENTNSDEPESVEPINYHEYQLRKKITDYTKEFKGTRYRYGGVSPDGFDCSGFTQYVMRKYDIELPRTASEQARVGKKVRQGKAQPGDLVFYKYSGDISHVSIVLHSSNDELLVIHSIESGGVAVEDIMKSHYWQSKMLYIRNVISNNF